LTLKFLLFLTAIYGFLLLGYGMKRLFNNPVQKSRFLSRFFMIFFTPPIILNAFWSIGLDDIRLITLPLIFVAVQSFAIIPALIFSRMLTLNKGEAGSFASCSVFSNTGSTLGIFLCYVLFGDRGLYLASWYITLYIPYYYFIGFPLMSFVAGETRPRMGQILMELGRNPVSIVPIAAIICGISMNLTSIPRPALLNYLVTRYLTYTVAAGYSFAIGLSVDFHQSIKYIKHSLVLSTIKFIYNPIISSSLLFLFGYFSMEDLLPVKVVLVESFMPTAIMAVVLVKLFRLNEDLANAAWILTTFLVIPVIPVMLFL
jgi:predicted permease